jgi:8-oxo-dGTP diphosphatase
MADDAAMDAPPPLRPTVRVLLLDPQDRLLMMRGRLPSDPSGPSFWFTIGGGLEPGETLAAAAVRETEEETGLTDIELGPVVWRDEVVLPDPQGRPTLLQQSYILAHTAGGQLSRAGWQDLERDFCDELRWWRLEDLRQTTETLYPEGLAELLEDVLAGRISAEPLIIRTAQGPIRPIPRP